ncbi:NADH dehydrogenase (quinone), G subunit [delta proteobacterium NaphS2]|nr:NADH dehydrogenase (quinone), G subunit [delta proteobacterium NaphS2]
MVTIYIEEEPYEVPEGKNLLETCLSLGFDLPYFCWHPSLGSAGACRQCAVKQFKDENDTKGRIVMACMTPVKDGVRISIQDSEAKEFRSRNIEWLMANHPHDCPVCGEGGECHLQDMTVMSGHVRRDHRFAKRTHHNQDLGPLIEHEMNRCISCYRCVRFYTDYAGGRDFNVFGAHDHVYFGRFEDGPFESEFSGNLVEICPTGVFTDKTLHGHYTRKWDLQTAPSICVLCGAGCNTIPGERYGTLRRIRNRYHSGINGYFLCDRGRFGYEFVNSERRVRHAARRLNKGAPLEALSQDQAGEHLASILSAPGKMIGIGSPRASLEANYALRTLVGAERFCTGIGAGEAGLLRLILEILQKGPARSPSIWDMEKSDAVLVLGEDVTQVMPRAALALRQSVRQEPIRELDPLHIPLWQAAGVRTAIQDEKGPFFVATPHETRLDDVATLTYRGAPDDLARLGFAVAHVLDPKVPVVEDLEKEIRVMAEAIAGDLKAAERPLIVSGISLGNLSLVQAAANIAFALCDGEQTADLAFLIPEANTMGLAMMDGMDLDVALELVRKRVRKGEADNVIILENDLYQRMAPKEADALLGAGQVVVLDYLETGTTRRADLVLPTATFAECTGTLVNYEGRAQRFFQVFEPAGDLIPSHRRLARMVHMTGREGSTAWDNLDDITKALAAEMPIFAPLLSGVLAPGAQLKGMKVPRQSTRYSGRTSMHADRNVNVPTPPHDSDAPLSFSMEGFHGPPPAALIPRYWAPGWNSVQALNKFQEEVGGPLRGGETGQRLIELPAQQHKSYFETVPPAFRPEPEKWLFVPMYHMFGSEPLSMETPGIARLAPRPSLALNPEDLESLGLSEGAAVLIGRGLSLPVTAVSSLPRGVAGFPVEKAGYLSGTHVTLGPVPGADEDKREPHA